MNIKSSHSGWHLAHSKSSINVTSNYHYVILIISAFICFILIEYGHAAKPDNLIIASYIYLLFWNPYPHFP